MCCNGGPRTALAAVELLDRRNAQRKQETRNKKQKEEGKHQSASSKT